MLGRFRIAVAALCIADGACASDDDGGSPAIADAGLDAGFSCESSGGAGESFELRLGLRSGEERAYVELEDGGEAPLVLGYQGLYMLLLESQAVLPVDSDAFCLQCAMEMSPSTSGSFAGAS